MILRGSPERDPLTQGSSLIPHDLPLIRFPPESVDMFAPLVSTVKAFRDNLSLFLGFSLSLIEELWQPSLFVSFFDRAALAFRSAAMSRVETRLHVRGCVIVFSESPCQRCPRCP